MNQLPGSVGMQSSDLPPLMPDNAGSWNGPGKGSDSNFVPNMNLGTSPGAPAGMDSPEFSCKGAMNGKGGMPGLSQPNIAQDLSPPGLGTGMMDSSSGDNSWKWNQGSAGNEQWNQGNSTTNSQWNQ